MTHSNRIVTLLALALLVALPAAAKEKKKAAAAAAAADKAMAEAEALGRPGPEHGMLARLEGTWQVMGKAFVPGQDPVEMGGTMVNEMILGGRFLESKYQGAFMGQKFWGRGLDGYDRGTGKHFSHWVDSMTTGVIVFEGEADASGKVRTMYGERFEPSMGGMIREKAVTTIKSYSTYTYEAFMEGEDGEWVPTMRIVFTKDSDETGSRMGER